MKLNELHLARTTDFALNEGYNREQQEKLAHIRLMIAKQGKDPEPILNRIRGMIDPEFAKREGYKATLKQWVEKARRGEERVGNAYGKKIKITVLESIMMSEGILGDLSGFITKRISKIIGNERQENKLVAKVLDEHPEFAALQRYTNQAIKNNRPIYNDPKYWGLVNKLLGGKGEEVKRLAHSIFKRLLEEARLNQRGMLSECVMLEAKISDLMTGLGVPHEAAIDLLSKYGVQDDVGYRELNGLDDDQPVNAQASQVVQAGQANKADKAAQVVAASEKKYDKYDLEEENNEFNDLVILLAAAQKKAGNKPENAIAAVKSVLQSGAPIPGGPEAEVTADELMKDYSA